MEHNATGSEIVISKTVTEEMTALRAGSGSLRVLATPVLIALMEGASCELSEKLTEEGATTVGTMISVEHKAATPVGCTVTVKAVLTQVEGRKYCFDVSAWDEAGVVAEGKHERYAVFSERFMQRALAAHGID